MEEDYMNFRNVENQNREEVYEEYEDNGGEGNVIEEKIQKVIMKKGNFPQRADCKNTSSKITKVTQIKTNKKPTTAKKTYTKFQEYKPYNTEERSTHLIYTNQNYKFNPTIQKKQLISDEGTNNHQFHSSYYSKKNKTTNNNSYSTSSYKATRKTSYTINTNSNINKQQSQLPLRSNRNTSTYISNTNYSNYQNYVPSSRTTNTRKPKLLSGCVQCPNCHFIFNPNEQQENTYERKTEYIINKPRQITINNSNKLRSKPIPSNISSVSYAPFDTYSKRAVSTTIEKKTNYQPPNIFTNERGTTVFTQPKREVQVIRKSLGANGEVLEEEVGEESYVKRGRKNSGGSRFSYENRVKGGNHGCYESYHKSSSYKQLRRPGAKYH